MPSCPILKNVRIVFPLSVLQLSVRHRDARARARKVDQIERWRDSSKGLKESWISRFLLAN